MSPRGADPAQTTNTAATPATSSDSPAKKIFDQLDLNHDGMLSLDEFSRATFQQPATK
jgi:Ca2+-binding EF-hand superfamily protein